MKKTFLKGAVIALAGISLAAGNAMALSISFDDGNNGIVDLAISDGGSNDASALAGVVQYNGDIGNWELNTTVGTSHPASGTDTYPSLDLFSLSLEYTSSDIKEIAVTVEDSYANFADLDSTIKGFVASIGGTTAGDVNLSAVINGYSLNIDWDDMTHNGTAFSGASTVALSDIPVGPDPFTMSLTAVVKQGTGITTLDANIAPVPEPATMLLFGTGLLGLAGVVRKKKIQ